MRAFVLGQTVQTCALYEGSADPAEGCQFIETFAQAHHLPPTCVVDAGYIKDTGWAVIEVNAT